MADVPADTTAGIAVYDRKAGWFTELHDADRQFRAASLVKLLLALDVLGDADSATLPEDERARLTAMLRSSDDTAASHYWSTRGGSAIVTRTASRLGLTGTVPPPASHPGYWGYTATTAADVVRIYRYILDSAPGPVHTFMMAALHSATRCGNDGFDQYFGIPSAFDGPRAVKQGWSGFTSGGCVSTPEARAVPEPVAATAPGTRPASLDLVSEALHTTGTVGPDDRTVVAVLTLHPDGTPYGTAYGKVTLLTDSLDVPGAVRPAGTRYGTWGSGVRVRAAAGTGSAHLATLPAGVQVLVGCQSQGERVTVPPYTNDWWAYLPQYRGWISQIYISSPGDTLPGVPDCP
ncbi:MULTISPECIES: hypothetical protein [unclassified Streptomyces]|uniref:hypothetical protein n=2 Tax=Streptomyces TaxID=1883 RepID=UPI000378E17B|nr:hypothetical protein [Streptomyces sp. SID4920]MYX67203.1 hypothetical protein [Streptomyces sp. SID8373]